MKKPVNTRTRQHANNLTIQQWNNLYNPMPSLSNKSVDKLFLGLIIGLSVFGLIVLLSASGPVSFQHYSDPLYFLRRQIIFGLLPGAAAFFLISRMDERVLRRLAFPSLVASFILLLLVYVPGLGHAVGGSASWINVFSFRIQPSEFVKVTFLVYVSAWLASRSVRRTFPESAAGGRGGGLAKEDAFSFFGALVLIVALLVVQPDTGTMFVIAATVMLLYLASGAPLVWFFTACGTGLLLLTILINATKYRADRFMTFLHPELDPQGIGYHINQAFLAIGSGGLFGLGYGQSRQKFLYLPEVQGDSIFAVMAEELGFIVALLFLIAVGMLVWRCFAVARASKDPFGKFLAMGVGIWIGVQTFVNVASMTGLMPITGVTLPFVSYGNSSTLSMFIGLGLVAAVSRKNRAHAV
jgi:cell division protein FtsW